jgi:hypothetical protein
MNELFIIYGVVLLVLLVILGPAIVRRLRRGRQNNSLPKPGSSEGMGPLNEKCDICQEYIYTNGMTRQYVLIKTTFEHHRTYKTIRTTQMAVTKASVCERCYQENAGSMANQLEGHGLFASLERWYNKNNPLPMNEMVRRIAKEKLRLVYPGQDIKVSKSGEPSFSWSGIHWEMKEIAE